MSTAAARSRRSRCAASSCMTPMSLARGRPGSHGTIAPEASQTVAGTPAERPCWRKVRTAQGSAAGNTCPPTTERPKARIRATETSRFSSGETGNLCVQQHQVGGRRPGPGSPRVDGIEPCGRPPAQTNGGHGAAPARAWRRTESGLSARFTYSIPDVPFPSGPSARNKNEA